MKLLRTGSILFLALGALPAESAIAQATGNSCSGNACPELLYIGTRTEGTDTGIVAARLDPVSGELTALGLAVPIVHPTWLVASPHRSILYSVSEVGNNGATQASVHSFAADKYEEVYLRAYGAVSEARASIGQYLPAWVSGPLREQQLEQVRRLRRRHLRSHPA